MPEPRHPRPMTLAWGVRSSPERALVDLMDGLALTDVPAQHGACFGHDPELWFAEGATRKSSLLVERAKTLCRTCDIQAPCLALGKGQEGTWGGLTQAERRLTGDY